MPATLSLVLAMALWGSSFIAMKYAVNGIEPEAAMFLRMLVTVICCGLLWHWVRKFEYKAGDWKPLLIMSLAEPCLYFLFEAHAMKYTSASQAGVLTACLPLMVAVIAFIALKERASKYTFIGFTVCIVGSIGLTLASPIDSHAPNAILGNSLEALAMLCAAVYTISVKYLSTRYSPLSLIGIQSLAGTLFFALLLPLGPREPFAALNTEAALSIIYLGMFVTLGAYGLYNLALSQVSVLKVAAFTNLIPIFTLFLSAVILRERLELAQWAAVACVFLGVYISQKHGNKLDDEASPVSNAV